MLLPAAGRASRYHGAVTVTIDIRPIDIKPALGRPPAGDRYGIFVWQLRQLNASGFGFW